MGEGFGKPIPPTGEQPSATRASQADAADPGGASDGKERDSRDPRKPLGSPIPPNQRRESSRREERTMAKATRRRGAGAPARHWGRKPVSSVFIFRARGSDGQGKRRRRPRPAPSEGSPFSESLFCEGFGDVCGGWPVSNPAGWCPTLRKGRWMSDTPSPALPRDSVARRALELNALAAILPMERCDRLAGILPMWTSRP
jgi:hypothetical protein